MTHIPHWLEPSPKPNHGQIREQITDALVELRGLQFEAQMRYIAYAANWPFRNRFFVYLHFHRQAALGERFSNACQA